MVLVGDDRTHLIPKTGLLPEDCNLRPQLRGEQFRIENTAVQIDARAGGIAAAGAFLRMEGGVSEIMIDVESSNAGFRDAQLAHASAGVKFEAVVPRFSELNRMLRRIGGNGFRRGELRSAGRRHGLVAAELARQRLRRNLEPGHEPPRIHALRLSQSVRQVQHA